MLTLEFLSYIIILIYGVLISGYLIGWIRLKQYKFNSLKKNIPVSIVVACRNEENNIQYLLKSLHKQKYPKELIQILLINDHSDDQTRNIISDYIKDKSNFNLLDLPKTQTGKKAALMFGIQNSRYETIITTDADCHMDSNWLDSMCTYYYHHKPVLLSGPVEITKSKSLSSEFQSLEFASLIASGAGAIGIHKPIMCNGANLLFEKSLYLESNKKHDFASGDDIFLMLAAKKIAREKIHFLKSKDAIVYTKALKTFNEFINQRIRWVSKSKAYRDFDIIFTSFVVALVNVILSVNLIGAVFNQTLLIHFIILLSIKSIFDFIFLFIFLQFFHRKNLLWLFIPTQIIYPFYISISVFLGLVGKFRWKNRKSE